MDLLKFGVLFMLSALATLTHARSMPAAPFSGGPTTHTPWLHGLVEHLRSSGPAPRAPRVARSPGCLDENRQVLHARWVSHTTRLNMHHSYYLYPGLQRNIDHLLNQSTVEQAQHLYGSQECPTLSQIQQREHVEERSLCPWYNIINYDSNRYPDQIVEAECSCHSGCVGMDDTTTGCEKIYYNVPVLRRVGCVNGHYQYTNGWHRIAVGCVCALIQASS